MNQINQEMKASGEKHLIPKVQAKKRMLVSCFHGVFVQHKRTYYEKEWECFQFIHPEDPRLNQVQYSRGDVRDGLPWPDEEFDVVYLHGIVEHLNQEEVADLIREVSRLLKADGIVRISTPDLEQIIRLYVETLGDMDAQPDELNRCRHHWSHLHLYDQMIRRRSGGCIYESIQAGYFDKADTQRRFGAVFPYFGPRATGETMSPLDLAGVYKRMRMGGERKVPAIRRFKRWLRSGLRRNPISRPQPWQIWESNKWLYDRVSLQQICQQNGFPEFRIFNYDDSQIPGWEEYGLDTSPDGQGPFKPALFVETRKRSG